MNIKGSLPLLILQILSENPKHGYLIAKEIKQRSQQVLNISEGTLYPTLHDLEKRGLIEAFEQEHKGRTRRCYRITTDGQAELIAEREEWTRFSQSVNLILGDA